MALVDLASLDLLDALLAHNLSEEQTKKMLQTYIQSYTLILSDALGKELTEKDDEEMKKLMQSPDVTPEKIDDFYKTRIPHFEAKVVLAGLEFKKRFLLSVYYGKLKQIKDGSLSGQSEWEQIVKSAEEDNWNEVTRLLKVVDTMSAEKTATPSSPPPAAK